MTDGINRERGKGGREKGRGREGGEGWRESGRE